MVAMRLDQGCLDALKRRCSDNKSGQLPLTLQGVVFYRKICWGLFLLRI
nr:MAG TPA: hypothetical protein [Caudoviricetes sp.]